MVDRFIVTMDATLQYSSITVYSYVEGGECVLVSFFINCTCSATERLLVIMGQRG